MTRFLVALNAGVFIWSLLPSQKYLLAQWGVRPRCYIAPSGCGIALPDEAELLWQPLFGSMFLHGDVLHLAFNMLFLWVFAPGLEEKLGRIKFLVFYLACGIGASLAHIATHPFSGVPAIGASGAISGVLGAYFILLTRSWILTYFPPIFVFPVPAPLFLGLWFLFQIGNFWSNITWLPQPLRGAGQGSDVAWMAHIGGFVFGALWAWKIKPWKRKKRLETGG
jgi:membrane associated rhomboid family serine protease